MDKSNVFVVIPGLNEEAHIGQVVKQTISLGFQNVVFVDDGSKDNSANVAEDSGAIVVRHLVNLGKGAAAKTGCDYCLMRKAKVLVMMDADGQHKPKDIERLVAELERTKSDMVFGYRRIDKNMPFVMKFGNYFINSMTWLIEGINLRDTQSGFRCFTKEAYKKIRWTSNDYSMESEMITRVAKNKLKYSQIEIATIYIDSFKGTTIFDGIKIFINILKFWIFGGRI